MQTILIFAAVGLLAWAVERLFHWEWERQHRRKRQEELKRFEDAIDRLIEHEQFKEIEEWKRKQQ